jgi:hypothetical protein
MTKGVGVDANQGPNPQVEQHIQMYMGAYYIRSDPT